MILVTGATGHLGNVLVRELIARGEKVRVLTLPGEDCTSLDGLDVEKAEGDVLDTTSLLPAFHNVHLVYHLAGIISIMPGIDSLVRQVNIQGTVNVLQAARRSGISRLVYTSSIHALKRVPHGITIDERIPFDPEHAISAYDQSKAEASLKVLDAVRQGLNAVIVCPTGVIGPYDFRRSEMGAVIMNAMQEKPQLYVEGAYDFVDVRDVAQGMILASEKGAAGESYILSGERLGVAQLLETVQKVRGIRSALLKVPMNLARLVAHVTPLYYRLTNSKPRFTRYALETLASNSVISNAKARRELGYAPRSLRETIADTVAWFTENRYRLVTVPLAVERKKVRPR